MFVFQLIIESNLESELHPQTLTYQETTDFTKLLIYTVFLFQQLIYL